MSKSFITYLSVKVGKTKYEAYIKDKKGSRKIIFVYMGDEIFIVTGAEGK
jgi:hypothetical protein